MHRIPEAQIFDAAHAITAKWEGGLTDHPSDTGKITNHGVSLVFLQGVAQRQEWRDYLDRIGVRLPVTRATIIALTKEQARDILKREFWMLPRLGELPPLVAIFMYVFGVNCGAGRAAILLQQAINILHCGAIPQTAANVGPLTRRWSDDLSRQGRQLSLALIACEAGEAWYRIIAHKRPDQTVFLQGWLNRAQDCRRSIESWARIWEIGGVS